MKQLKSGYELTFPSDEEIRITYPNPKRRDIWIGQILDKSTWLTCILILLVDKIGWIIVSIFVAISIYNLFFNKSLFPKNSLKEISLKTDNFKYSYAIGMNNREKHITPPMFIDFCVNVESDIIEISFMGIVLNLYDVDDLPIFIDKVAAMFDMKYVDTCRLSNHQEVLMYQRKGISNIIYPTLINVVRQSNGVEFYDMANQFFWLKFDELHQQIFYYDKSAVLPKLMISYHEVRQIDVILNTGKWVENGKNRIVVNVILNNNSKKMVFETMLRTKDKELTSYRDTNLIFMEMKRLQHLKSINITKQFNIQ